MTSRMVQVCDLHAQQILACAKLCRLHFDSLIPVCLIRWSFACRLTQISDTFLRPYTVCVLVFMEGFVAYCRLSRNCAQHPAVWVPNTSLYLFFSTKNTPSCLTDTSSIFLHNIYGVRQRSPWSVRHTHTTTHLTFVIITQHCQITVISGS